jgi:hypothetical protein
MTRPVSAKRDLAEGGGERERRKPLASSREPDSRDWGAAVIFLATGILVAAVAFGSCVAKIEAPGGTKAAGAPLSQPPTSSEVGPAGIELEMGGCGGLAVNTNRGSVESVTCYAKASRRRSVPVRSCTAISRDRHQQPLPAIKAYDGLEQSRPMAESGQPPISLEAVAPVGESAQCPKRREAAAIVLSRDAPGGLHFEGTDSGRGVARWNALEPTEKKAAPPGLVGEASKRGGTLPTQVAEQTRLGGETLGSGIAGAGPAGRYPPSVRRALDMLRLHESANGTRMTGDGGLAEGWLQQHEANWREGCERLGVRWPWPADTHDLAKCEAVCVANWERYCPDALERGDVELLVRSHRLPCAPWRADNDAYWRRVSGR